MHRLQHRDGEVVDTLFQKVQKFDKYDLKYTQEQLYTSPDSPRPRMAKINTDNKWIAKDNGRQQPLLNLSLTRITLRTSRREREKHKSSQKMGSKPIHKRKFH